MHNRMRSAVLVLGIVLVLIGMVDGSDTLPQSSITLERSMCFGTCPVYTVTLYQNGTVWYHGEQFVKEVGDRSEMLNATSFETLLKACEEAGFFQMNDEYVKLDITDMPGAIITLQNGTDVKRVEHYHGDLHAPKKIIELEDLIDQTVQISRWVGTGSDQIKEEMI
ncbi:MAG: DUF6438 domain-containing protein [Methanospirillum sp.]|uniref:DUF6438 domain-containing protein n=1 Tax=Methanospirillum sp. TaxID=45200 RepID=UPI0023758A0C|nr:DUF6438 domain-containing protein [Methanospirillum sp.]MDD1728902.1 DUF6438 domain-containing protein [Methanospirillum sp.]